MSILVATDFSPCSRAAVRLATAVARQRGVSLFLVHAIEPPPIDLVGVPSVSVDWERNVLAAAEVAVAHDASDIRQAGVAAECRAFVGSPSNVILETAQEQRADLIVLGTHGRKGPSSSVNLRTPAKR